MLLVIKHGVVTKLGNETEGARVLQVHFIPNSALVPFSVLLKTSLCAAGATHREAISFASM